MSAYRGTVDPARAPDPGGVVEQIVRVVIDPKHPVILALAQAEDVITLAAAIVTEANRATEALTDAEERRALISLLLET